jgi:hypothetical protein
MRTTGLVTAQILILCAACVALSFAGSAPQLVNVQGLLTDSSDEPIADGTYEVTFAIYDVENGGSALWTETRSVSTEDGLFTIILGETDPLTESVFTNSELWLGITVSGDTEMTPRQRLTSVPYALNTPEGESADTGNNVVTGLWAAIAGGTSNRADGDSSFIGGGAQNEVTGNGATIAGGVNNLAIGLHSSIGGGGGTGADSNLASGDYSTVSGGRGNRATRSEATIGGGCYNKAEGDKSTVGGGNLNEATGLESVVCGGVGNTAAGIFSTIGGGDYNDATVFRATVGGGFGNNASGVNSTIGGGDHNYTSGENSTVGGGLDNYAIGENSTVPGGSHNVASGDYSCAMGFYAEAAHAGSFIWADAQGAIIRTDTTNQFVIRAQHGVHLASMAGTAAQIAIGDYYRDNAIVAWGNVAGNGTSQASFGVSSIGHTPGSGVYRITVTFWATNADPDYLVMTASAEVDAIPTSAASARLIYVDQIDGNTFNVYITDGDFNAKDNEFTFIATAR